MLVDLKRMVAYICPFCSNMSSKFISVFNFSGKPKLELICPTHGCHEKCVTITPKNASYKIDIECPLCSAVHSYTASKESFWNKKLITYKCPAAGIDIFFAGERGSVEKVIDENYDIYSDVMEEFDEFDGLPGDDDAPFNCLFSIIERLHSLEAAHKITCACGSGDVEMGVVNGNIILSCKNCGRSRVIEANEDSLAQLLNMKKLVIGK